MTSTADADVGARPAPVPRLDSLTSLRFFAAMSVVVTHTGWLATTSTATHAVLALGYVGVSFFFVLSGFVLTWSMSPTRTRRRFYFLRFARIWPLHAVTTAYVGLFIAEKFWIPGATGIAAVLACTQAFSLRNHTYYGLNGVSWSLSCEAFFYLLFPFVVAFLLRRGQRALTAVAVLAVVALLVVPLATYSLAGPTGWASRHAEWLFFVNPVFRFGEFLLGVAVGCMFRAGRRLPISLGSAVLGVIGTVAVIAWLQISHGVHTPRPYVAAVLAPWFALVIAAAAGNDVARRPSLLRTQPLMFLGEASFALYLTHQIVQRSTNWAALATGRPHFVGFAAYLGVALVIASLAHLLVERPAERWLRRRPVGLPRASTGREIAVEDVGLTEQIAGPVMGADPVHSARTRT
jgi:peptidoglycan/LPS O-acetylase OafA/YrhL